MMSNKYQHLFFDLDHTLWDFDKNSEETLTELFYEFELDIQLNVKVDVFLKSYSEVNRKMWRLYNAKKITKELMREHRFSDVFKNFGFQNQKLSLSVNDAYLSRCPTKPHLILGTKELLEYCQLNYSCHIITNGFEETQHRKLKHSGIANFFDQIFTSESTGFTKPDRRIFHHALTETGAKPENSLMIGDNLSTDIRGARSMKIDQVYCNLNGAFHNEKTTFEVNNLNDLLRLL